MGYGNGYADVPTPAGIFPLVDPTSVLNEFATGAGQGVVAALVASGVLPSSALPDMYPYLPSAEVPGEVSPSSSVATTLDLGSLSVLFESIGL